MYIPYGYRDLLRLMYIPYGSLCEYMAHLRYRRCKKIRGRTRPSVGRSTGCARERGRDGHQRPCRRPLRSERAALALWAKTVHASSCDGGVDGRRPPYRPTLSTVTQCFYVCRRGADPEHAACTSPSAADHRIVDGHTQSMVLSVPINNLQVTICRQNWWRGH